METELEGKIPAGKGKSASWGGFFMLDRCRETELDGGGSGQTHFSLTYGLDLEEPVLSRWLNFGEHGGCLFDVQTRLDV